jgi:hypothetical protein
MQDMARKRPRPPDDSAAAIRSAAAAERSKPSETPTQPSKRVFTTAYKTRVLDELARARHEEKGAVGALIRREGLTWPTVLRWEQAHAKAGQAGLEPKKKGRPFRDGTDGSTRKQQQENERLRNQNEKLQVELQKAKLIIEVQKKLSALLGIELPTDPKDGTS